jgi:hypothetical protein
MKQITHLTNQKDADRLTLLKEVAGTKVYEERRAESTKIMDETSTSRRWSFLPLARSAQRLIEPAAHVQARRGRRSKIRWITSRRGWTSWKRRRRS